MVEDGAEDALDGGDVDVGDIEIEDGGGAGMESFDAGDAAVLGAGGTIGACVWAFSHVCLPLFRSASLPLCLFLSTCGDPFFKKNPKLLWQPTRERRPLPPTEKIADDPRVTTVMRMNELKILTLL